MYGPSPGGPSATANRTSNGACQLTFRGMLLWLQHYAEEWLGLHEELQAQHSVWG